MIEVEESTMRQRDQQTTEGTFTMTRQLNENDQHTPEAGDQSGQGRPGSAEQSGDAQGLSQAVEATEQSVRELAATGQDYEAQILRGVEDATDHPGKPVPDHGGH
jgi:hypothetical protein